MAARGRHGSVLFGAVLGVWQRGPDVARQWVTRRPSLLGCQRRCVSCVLGASFSGSRLASNRHGQTSALDCILGLSQPDSSLTSRVPAVSVRRDEQDLLLLHRPDMPENPRVLRVVLLGAPNAGKSTLSNQLLGRKVFPVSKKVHTTRCRALGVITEKEAQVVGTCNGSPANRTEVVVLVDVSDKWTRNQLSPQMLQCLTQFSQVPSILVMNKVDCLKQKSVLLELTAALTEGMVNGKKLKMRQAFRPQLSTHCPSPPAKGCNTQSAGSPQRIGWPHFQEIFMLSALSQEDVKTLKQYLLTQARPGPWEFHSGVLTSQMPEEICTNMIREKLLEHLPQEIPYSVQQVQTQQNALEAPYQPCTQLGSRDVGKTVVWEEGPSGELVIVQNLLVPKESHVKILIGPEGHLISCIAQEVSSDLMDIFLCDVQLRLSVKLLQ
ncbi:hypothetical protein MC885_003215 [Smutsia gigantea]|nr:hypothetical protein MC885_003215 [Smutsia gigantea]